jgi:hypothetical protein
MAVYDRGMSTDDLRLMRAIAGIDAENARDPVLVPTADGPRPRALMESELVSAWVRRLAPRGSDALLLAARAHHIRRWEHPRSSYPAGRGGYLRWRTMLYAFHADAAAAIAREAGFGDGEVERVRMLVGKRALGKDPEAQVLEDALCLAFFEMDFRGVAARFEREKLIGVLRKTWRKMSPAGREAALGLDLGEGGRAILEEALNPSA